MSAVTHVTDATFAAEVLASDKPVLIDFWAPWCGPCRAVGPVVDQIAAEQGEKIKVVKINTDESPATAARYGVMSVPTLLVTDRGEPLIEMKGALPKPRILRDLAPVLG